MEDWRTVRRGWEWKRGEWTIVRTVSIQGKTQFVVFGPHNIVRDITDTVAQAKANGE